MKNLFENLKSQNRAGLVLYVSCGDPSISFTEKLIERVCSAGADIIELSVPFSDPVAGGKTIQTSNARAIANGCNLQSIFDMVVRLRNKGVDKKFVLFSYYNPIFKYGVAKAAEVSAKVGVNSWLIVDVPMEESNEVTSELSKYGIDFIPLATTTSSLERIAEISKCGSGFIYYADAAGTRDSLPDELLAKIENVRKISVLPVAVGLGISSGEMATKVAEYSDAVMVVNKFVEIVNDSLDSKGEDYALDCAEKFVSDLSRAMSK
ncbi:MAG: tryptophan synthase subunit alpha [Opitutales bacterium]|nr:tryptophan synthase subunit alpha [Opitutales bacterium]